MPRILILFCLSLTLTLLLAPPTHAQVKLVATIKPLHSIAASVMAGVAKPDVLIDGFGSPHDFQLKPSQARLLQKADVILWIGPDLETFLIKPLSSLNQNDFEIMSLDTINKLEQRDHMDLGGHNHNDAIDEHDDLDDFHFDPHVWLDPANAIAIANELATYLSDLNPEHAATYEINAGIFAEKMTQTTVEIETILASVKNSKFFVFHDAFHYFEDAFDISASQAVTPSVEQKPGAKRIRQLKSDIKTKSISCVFVEPQGSTKLIDLAVEGSKAKTAELDVLGAQLEAGPNLYRQSLIKMATVMRDCLSTP